MSFSLRGSGSFTGTAPQPSSGSQKPTLTLRGASDSLVGASGNTDYRLIPGPSNRAARDTAYKKSVEREEASARRVLLLAESAARLNTINQLLLCPVVATMRSYQFPNLMTNAMPLVSAMQHGLVTRTGEGIEDTRTFAAQGTSSTINNAPRDSGTTGGNWGEETRQGFARVMAAQRSALTKQFSETHLEWYPHHAARTLYEEWKAFFLKWKERRSASRGAVASSLLSSFFCTILLDEEFPNEDIAIEISRLIMEETMQVTVDDPALRDPEEACTYAAFCHLTKNIASGLFPSLDIVEGVQTFVNVVSERVHRIH